MTATSAPTRRRSTRRRLAAAAALAAGATLATAAPASAFSVYTGGEVVDVVQPGGHVRLVASSSGGTTPYEVWLRTSKAVDDHVTARGYQGCYGYMYSNYLFGYGDAWYGWKVLYCPMPVELLPPVTIPPAPAPEPIPHPGIPPVPEPTADPVPEPERPDPVRPGPRPDPDRPVILA